MTTPLCPTCGQPASESLAGGPEGWECRNEACAEFGQAIRPDEPATDDQGGAMEGEQPNPTTEEVPEEITPEGLPPEAPEKTRMPGSRLSVRTPRTRPAGKG